MDLLLCCASSSWGFPKSAGCIFWAAPKNANCTLATAQREKKGRAIKVRSSPRLISTGQLNALLRLHTRPINLMVYQESYLAIQWEI
jgi:hypothetical protein